MPITPAPRGNGLAMRVWALITAAARDHDVALAVVPVAGNLDEDSNLPPEVTLRSLAVNSSVLDVLNAFQGPLPDAVLAARLSLVPLAAAVADAADVPLLVDLDEDDVALNQALGRPEEAERFRRLAAEHLPRATLITVASSADVEPIAGRYGLGAGVTTVPNCVRIPARSRRVAPGAGRVIFLGNLTYPPNVDAARWLATDILEALPPDMSLDLVGQPDSAVEELAGPRVRVHGYVADLTGYYANADVAVAPLRFGAGTRIKVLEAFAHRVPVVTTPKGVQGLSVVDGVHALVAKDGPSFARAIERARQPDEGARLADAAYEWVAAHHDSDVVIGRLADVLARATVDAARARPGPDDVRPRAAAGLDVNDAEDGLVVYGATTGAVHHLNSTVAAVFVLCNGGLTVTDITEEIQKAFGLDAAPADEVARCLAGLRGSGLVE
ncbi:MAG TPA: PqqD family peptide modification chaperone [Sporichthyaceae bacterium]|jgi:glycosyltransferase involved in cell wall biosynthesis